MHCFNLYKVESVIFNSAFHDKKYKQQIFFQILKELSDEEK